MSRYIPPVRVETAAGHIVRSVVAHDEPERHRVRALADLASALPRPEVLARRDAAIRSITTTPDFHPGKPVPVGVAADVEGAVMPHLIGNDIGCGMRMLAIDGLDEDYLQGRELEVALRHAFFQGGRDVALRGRDRHAILRDGVPGLLEAITDRREGLLARCDLAALWRDVDRMSDAGSFRSSTIDPDFQDYANRDDRFHRDAILGTIGGGNHFVEFGVTEQIRDGIFAQACGLRKGSVVLVVHSGSLDSGQRVGSVAKERLAAARNPDGEHRIAAQGDDIHGRYMNGHANAANAAFVNRLLIGLAAMAAISRVLGREVGHRLIYDAPHNTVWERGGMVRHRKGACPASGPGELKGSPYEWLGEPVILPGSMGDGTWLLRGLGSIAGLASSAHGAGRKLSRQEARAGGEVDTTLRVVGPLDRFDPALRGRPDILAELSARLREEAPAAYRRIDLVVDPMVEAGLVDRVAKIRPVLTVKG